MTDYLCKKCAFSEFSHKQKCIYHIIGIMWYADSIKSEHFNSLHSLHSKNTLVKHDFKTVESVGFSMVLFFVPFFDKTNFFGQIIDKNSLKCYNKMCKFYVL